MPEERKSDLTVSRSNRKRRAEARLLFSCLPATSDQDSVLPESDLGAAVFAAGVLRGEVFLAAVFLGAALRAAGLGVAAAGASLVSGAISVDVGAGFLF